MKINEVIQKLTDIAMAGHSEEDLQVLSRSTNALAPIESIATSVNDETGADQIVLTIP